ncbi:MAG: hypothetical protein K8963_02090, partial [Proteobacteria bacterium]|nr:hypothetical protein [Pseudomonadota bacterium]
MSSHQANANRYSTARPQANVYSHTTNIRLIADYRVIDRRTNAPPPATAPNLAAKSRKIPARKQKSKPAPGKPLHRKPTGRVSRTDCTPTLTRRLVSINKRLIAMKIIDTTRTVSLIGAVHPALSTASTPPAPPALSGEVSARPV